MTEPTIKHGICRRCSKRRYLWKPADICSACVRKADQKLRDLYAGYAAELEDS